MNSRRPILIAVCIALSACAAPPVAQQAPTPAATPAADAGQRLHALVERYFDELLPMDPLLATFIGDKRYNDRLPNFIGPEHRARAHFINERYLAEVRKIDPTALGPAERITYDSFVRERQLARTGERFPDHLLPVNQTSSLLTTMPALGSGTNAQPFATAQDYDNWLERLDGFVVWMDQAVANMREGMAKGVVQPRPLMEKVLP